MNKDELLKKIKELEVERDYNYDSCFDTGAIELTKQINELKKELNQII